MNHEAVDAGINSAHRVEVPADWADAVDAESEKKELPEFIENILVPMNAQKGDDLPSSAFAGIEDGTFPSGTAAYEKRGVAVLVPEWDAEKCIQCNQCSFICPHATIRPVLLSAEEKAAAPEGFKTVATKGKGLEDYEYRMQVSPLDCLGCGNCADICPVKALEMKPLDTQEAEAANWEFAMKTPVKDDLMDKGTVKGSQFAKPYFEFSGACAGCGETPYIKVVTQLFGERMMIANATGCSSIWGASAPSMPYCKDENGRGPSWGNSLFEDNAEYGLGMASTVEQMRTKIEVSMKELVDITANEDVKAVCRLWLDNMTNGDESMAIAAKVKDVLEGASLAGREKELADDIMAKKDWLVKKSIWCLGGDGWAYDIGYGGLDHALASGKDINVLVFDTEVYSNTGGQASKFTPIGAVAQFAAAGKRTKKKDLGMMAMSYGYVYVAQVAMGADKNQFLKAIKAAEAYNGPSLIICYAPCINHGLKKGMGKTQENEADAVKCGYWNLYRFDPESGFSLDSKDPTEDFNAFIMDQVRYSSLVKEFPETAEVLFKKTEADAKARLESYKRLAGK